MCYSLVPHQVTRVLTCKFSTKKYRLVKILKNEFSACFRNLLILDWSCTIWDWTEWMHQYWVWEAAPFLKLLRVFDNFHNLDDMVFRSRRVWVKAETLPEGNGVYFGSTVDYILLTFLVLGGREQRTFIVWNLMIGGGKGSLQDDLKKRTLGVLMIGMGRMWDQPLMRVFTLFVKLWKGPIVFIVIWYSQGKKWVLLFQVCYEAMPVVGLRAPSLPCHQKAFPYVVVTRCLQWVKWFSRGSVVSDILEKVRSSRHLYGPPIVHSIGLIDGVAPVCKAFQHKA